MKEINAFFVIFVHLFKH